MESRRGAEGKGHQAEGEAQPPRRRLCVPLQVLEMARAAGVKDREEAKRRLERSAGPLRPHEGLGFYFQALGKHKISSGDLILLGLHLMKRMRNGPARSGDGSAMFIGPNNHARETQTLRLPFPAGVTSERRQARADAAALWLQGGSLSERKGSAQKSRAERGDRKTGSL